jgi:tetratricopeptide (TPR) repeat protein
MKKSSVHWCWCGLFLLLSACAGNEAAFQSEYAATAAQKSGPALFSALLLLDQKYPSRLALKVDIGTALLAAGDLEKAGIYLKSGEALAGRSKDKRLKALLYSALSELSSRSGRYPETIELAGKALEFTPNPPVGVLFIRGKAYQAIGRTKEALEDFSLGWSAAPGAMLPEDFRTYSALLIQAARYQEALEAYTEYQVRFLYETGIGLTESLLYEKLGKIEESVIAAFKELEYRRYLAGVPEALILDNLQKLGRKLEDRQWNPEGRGKALVEALQRYVRGDWKEAERSLQKPGPIQDLPFGRYLLLSARLEATLAAEADFQNYRLLEPYLKGLPAYYYHLWRGMRSGSGTYTPAIARPVLEKCILLAPQTPFALDGRRELGRLIGLAPAEGQKLLLAPELESIGRQVVSGADLGRLNPVLELLSTPDSEYQLSAVLLLKQLKSREQVHEYLAERARTSTGRLKERLAFVMSD